MNTDRSLILRAGAHIARVTDRMARAPRWVDVPWAVLSVVGMAVSYVLESGPPYWWSGLSLLGFMTRLNVTDTRLRNGTSSLNPMLDRWMDRRKARQARKDRR